MDKKRILAIDDEEEFLKIIKLNLEKTGKYEVLGLSDASDIIEQVNTFKPDAVLLDLLMPVIGGIDVCDRLNDDPFGKTIPIIVLTALGKDEDKLKAYKSGVVDYLVKPIEKKDLINKIEKVLRYKSAED